MDVDRVADWKRFSQHMEEYMLPLLCNEYSVS